MKNKNDVEVILLKLDSCLLKHCGELGENLSDFRTFSYNLFMCVSRSNVLLGSRQDLLIAEKVRRKLSEAERLIENLSENSLNLLNDTIPLLEAEKSLNFEEAFKKVASEGGSYALRPERVGLNIVENRKVELRLLREGIDKLVRKLRASDGPVPRFDHRAVMAAKECGRIWATKTGKKTPSELQHDREEQAIQVFVKDVFSILSIKSAPSSAFARLKALGIAKLQEPSEDEMQISLNS